MDGCGLWNSSREEKERGSEEEIVTSLSQRAKIQATKPRPPERERVKLCAVFDPAYTHQSRVVKCGLPFLPAATYRPWALSVSSASPSSLLIYWSKIQSC